MFAEKRFPTQSQSLTLCIVPVRFMDWQPGDYVTVFTINAAIIASE